MDIKQIQINGLTYNIKDEVARESLGQAISSVGALAGSAKETAENAKSTADSFSAIASDAQVRAIEAKQTSEEARQISEEAKQIALGANRSITFATYKELVHTLEGGSGVFEYLFGAKAKVGQNIYIAALNVPDCWIAEVDEQGMLTSSEYDTESPTFDNDIASLLVSENGLVINTWIRLRALETQKVDLTKYDKEINDLKNKKQDILVSGENIKTVGGESVLGEGDMAVVKGLYDPIGGRTYTPDETGTIQVPYAPLGGINQNGRLLSPDSMGIVTIEAAEAKEWVGTQAEFDKLTTYDEKTTYYIV